MCTYSHNFLELGQSVIQQEADTLHDLAQSLTPAFSDACDLLLKTQGRVVVTGMGKSGHIAGKVAATLASTGTPAFFVHPGEASHGDLGMLTPHDTVLLFSHSGKTPELLTILPRIKRLSIPLISVTGHPDSPLAMQSDAHLHTPVSQEACALNLAPTASTTAALAMGDALAMALSQVKKFTPEDFAASHPGGSLGKRLLLTVKDVMHTGERLPMVPPTTPLPDALVLMTQSGLGMTAVVDTDNTCLGVFTDGDLRRVLKDKLDIHALPIEKAMTRQCQTIGPETLIASALHDMEQNRINGYLVVNEQNQVIGAFNMHDLVLAGVL